MATLRNRTPASRNNNKRSRTYLTKRILVRAAKAGIVVASDETIEAMGFNVIAHNGRVVRRYADGHMVDIAAIEQANPVNGHIPLD